MTGFTIDYHGGRRQQIGDGFLKARGVYRITAMREVDSRVWPDRWRYEAVNVGRRSAWNLTPGPERLATFGFAPGAVVIETVPYDNGTRPGEPGFEKCLDPTCEGCR